jgi:hypothetical protein
MSQTTARYLFGDILTGDVIVEAPMQGVSMSRQLNDWGTFRGTTYLSQAGLPDADVIAGTIPGKCFVVVEIGSVPVWGGLVWSRTYDSLGKDLQLTARTWEAYLEHVFVSDFVRSSTEQLQIFADLFADMQSDPYKNLQFVVPAGPYPVLQQRDLTVLHSDYRNYLETISGFADGNDGFDWTVDTLRDSDSGAYIKSVRMAFPTLGNPDAAPLAFDYPGNVLNYWQTDGLSAGGTQLFLLGTGEGSDMLVGDVIQTDQLANGFPKWDISIARKDIGIQANLDSMAVQLGAQRRLPYTTIKFATKADLEPLFGSYGLGDSCTIAIVDPRHSEGFQRTARIIAWEYTPSADDNIASVTLTFEGDALNE